MNALSRFSAITNPQNLIMIVSLIMRCIMRLLAFQCGEVSPSEVDEAVDSVPFADVARGSELRATAGRRWSGGSTRKSMVWACFPTADTFEPLRSAWARPAPSSLITPCPWNVASSKSPYVRCALRCAPLRSSSWVAAPSVVWLHAIGQLLSPAGRCLSISTVCTAGPMAATAAALGVTSSRVSPRWSPGGALR